jgi:hypothetical protein
MWWRIWTFLSRLRLKAIVLGWIPGLVSRIHNLAVGSNGNRHCPFWERRLVLTTTLGTRCPHA